MKNYTLLSLLLLPFFLYSQQENTIKEVPIDSVSFHKIILKGFPDFLAADGNDMWVLNKNKVEKLSANNQKPRLTVNIPGACGAMLVGFNSLWVASCKKQSVYRINKNSGKIMAVVKCGIADLSGEISLAAGDGSVWILSDKQGILTRISPQTNTIEAQIPVLPDSYCAVFGFNAVWVSNTNNNSVQRIDPETNRVIATIPVGNWPRFLAAGEKGVWTLNQKDGTVSHINPDSNKVVSAIDTKVPGSGGDIAAGGGYVWVRSTKGRLLQAINPLSDSVETIYTPVAGSGAVRVSEKYVWVTAHDINTIWILNRQKL
ncbi:MAG: hypothetical protein ACM3H8_03275 [Sphingobacteriales bacterium]